MSYLLTLARGDLKGAKYFYEGMVIDEVFRNKCCYELQQCIEKTIKYILELKGIRYPISHDIGKLADLLVDIELKNLLIPIADTVTKWESSSRYSENFFALKETIDNVMELADKLILIAEDMQLSGEVLINLQSIEDRLLKFNVKYTDLADKINEINSFIPSTQLNNYGKTKLERVYNFIESYAKIFNE